MHGKNSFKLGEGQALKIILPDGTAVEIKCDCTGESDEANGDDSTFDEPTGVSLYVRAPTALAQDIRQAAGPKVSVSDGPTPNAIVLVSKGTPIDLSDVVIDRLLSADVDVEFRIR